MRIYSIRVFVGVVAIASVLAMSYYGVHALTKPERLPVNKVTITGEYRHVDPKKLEDIVLPHTQQNFLRVPVASIKHDLLQLSWVDKVAVKRVWPDTLAIHIVEHQPIAQWCSDGFITREGLIFPKKQTDSSTALAILCGPLPAAKRIVDDYRVMQTEVQSIPLTIVELHASDRFAVTLVLSNGTRVLLGSENKEARLRRFIKVYDRIFAPSKKRAERVDLRYRHGLAVKWQ